MSIEFYDGKQVFARLPGDLFFFWHVIAVLDDWLFDDCAVYQDSDLRSAWISLLDAVDASFSKHSLSSGTGSIADAVCLFRSEELAEPWEDDHGSQEV